MNILRANGFSENLSEKVSRVFDPISVTVTKTFLDMTTMVCVDQKGDQ